MDSLLRSIRSVHRLLLLLSLLVFPLAAQTNAKPLQTGNLSVIVADPSGAFVSNAEVGFTGERKLTTRTGRDGSAHVTLPYGSYAVIVKSQGFEAAKIIDLPIRVPKPPDLKVVLQLGNSVPDPMFETPIPVETITSDLPNAIAPRVFASANLVASDSDFGFLWICSVRAAAHQGEPQKLVGSVVIGVYPSTDKRRESFTIADESGYVMIPLRPGNYCAEPYGTNGKKLPLDRKTNGGRPICFDIEAHKVAEAGLTISHDVDYKPAIPSKGID